MAKKNDLDEENINEENQGGDINEADDSFGLPDVDYKPLEEQEVVQEEPAEEPEPDPEPETTVEEEETYAYTADSSDSYGETSEEGETNETEYVPGSYTPPKEEGNKAGIIIGVIILLLIAAAAIWYWGFHLPAERVAEEARIEQQRQEKIEEDRKAAAAKAEADRIAQEEAAAAAEEEEAEAEPEAGTIETISARTGRYYVVIASAIDGDLAMDYAKELSEAGESVKIIEPYGKVKFYRVAVQGLDSWDEAQSKANELKADYGDGVWVIKY